jgi:hypothetical protein
MRSLRRCHVSGRRHIGVGLFLTNELVGSDEDATLGTVQRLQLLLEMPTRVVNLSPPVYHASLLICDCCILYCMREIVRHWRGVAYF